MEPLNVPNLTVSGCRGRQARLREVLTERKLDVALIGDRRHVYYFTGFWCRPLYNPLVLIERNGGTTISVPFAGEHEIAADKVFTYESNRFCTLVDDQWSAALDCLRPDLSSSQRLGGDGVIPFTLGPMAACEDLRPAIWTLRRTKDEDELALLRCAVAATERAYRAAFDALRPGITEVELFAVIQGAMAEAVGEFIGEIGNDFQICSPGGPPRRRAGQAGEIAVLDLSIVLRGYNSDLCRSFVVGRQPSEPQLAAWRQIEQTIAALEAKCRPGMRCQQLFDLAAEMLDGFRGWKFGHHLGHGIGLCPHEAPRLNPNWDDTLEIGDVFTMEPGLYGKELRAGMRIEQNYALTNSGLIRLSEFPSSLA
ncbi:MAG: aminopeptidase P family protein [Pirellulales bacterium]|nr:aminopeptidase P family protein [Pirellulales bacterium]